MNVETRALGEVVVLVPEAFHDERGFFMESFRADQFKSLGLPHEFLQDNHSRSTRGVVRGLHFQYEAPMGKLMRVTVGSAYLVAVDIRKGSPTLGRCFGIEASAENRRQVWAPAGFARGFCVLSAIAEVQYKCTALYNQHGESGIRWDDPALAIPWPLQDVKVSEKDRRAPTLEQWLQSPLASSFQYRHAAEN
ncbi:MAG TPA: dTDP-4-dehydrorhamnose 3,5-epimerase [Terriglobales bacterium]|nr:dTDP-4-dehydrorhamnose 3,5-epimerase [Terriglobales bacterium]